MWGCEGCQGEVGCLPTLIASGSMSNACILPVGDMAASMALVWPPRPNVPSTYTPPGFGAIIFSTVSSHSAGWWIFSWPSPPDTLFAGCT